MFDKIKRKKDLMSFLVVLTIICVLIFSYRYIEYSVKTHNSNIQKVDDIESFFDNSYSEYNGGEKAKEFFDSYVYLNEYKDIAFNYIDAEKYISFLRTPHTAFIVDVYYEEDVFYEIAEKILPDTNAETISEMTTRNFDVSIITLDKELYRENTACVMFDLEYNTIRYAFIYKLPVVATDVRALGAIELSLPDLHWNSNESDWIFDYNQ